MQLRASTKFIKLGYVFCLAMAVGIAAYLKSTGPTDEHFWWVLIVPAFLMVILLARHIKRRMIKLDIVGDRVRYESGFFSKMTRTEEVIKLQDVQVHQTLGQRMMGIGDLSFETAGGSSRIVMHSIDRPQVAADHILELAKTQRLRPDAGHPSSQGTP
ncbi:MAG TPA: PH domain-containing protein [Bryobacteraceae bacterium]|nr:PH domain-containing protein [Bryobacteraceae bacterium]